MGDVAIHMAVGDVEDAQHPFWGKCGGCGHCWTVCYLPMDMSKAAKLMGKAACPKGCSSKVFIAKQDNGVLLEPNPHPIKEDQPDE